MTNKAALKSITEDAVIREVKATDTIILTYKQGRNNHGNYRQRV